MMGTKQARKFGGRPVEREPERGKRTQLNIAVPLPLKRKVEQAAKKRGWSISSEAAYRLEMSFSPEVVTTTALKEMLEEILERAGAQGRDLSAAAASCRPAPRVTCT